MPMTLLSLFSQVSDPRRDQGKMYPLAPILLFTVLAMLAGARSYRQVHGSGLFNADFLIGRATKG